MQESIQTEPAKKGPDDRYHRVTVKKHVFERIRRWAQKFDLSTAESIDIVTRQIDQIDDKKLTELMKTAPNEALENLNDAE